VKNPISFGIAFVQIINDQFNFLQQPFFKFTNCISMKQINESSNIQHHFDEKNAFLLCIIEFLVLKGYYLFVFGSFVLGGLISK
jgi:hypothetical protein